VPLNKGTHTDLSFCNSDDYVGFLSIPTSNSCIIIYKKSMYGGLVQLKNENNQVFIFVDNPRLTFMKIIKRMKNTQEPVKRISNSAVISYSSRIRKDCHIGNFVVVDDHRDTGDNTIISSGVGLQNTITGDNCMIQSGTTIGEDGFVLEREAETSELERFSHDGKS
jgi:UDP-3-O-[3-hydroxymyristoyl] glucosamine N-acyltransferase